MSWAEVKKINSNLDVPIDKMFNNRQPSELRPVNHANLSTLAVGTNLVEINSPCILLSIYNQFWIYYNQANATAIYKFSLYIDGWLYDRFVTDRGRYDSWQHYMVPVSYDADNVYGNAVFPTATDSATLTQVAYNNIRRLSNSTYRTINRKDTGLLLPPGGLLCNSIRLRYDGRSGTVDSSDSMYAFNMSVIFL